jgi:hypothetical protein
MKKTHKEFALSSWAIDHKTVIYVIMAIFFFLGIRSYNVMPRECLSLQYFQEIPPKTSNA